MKAFKLARYNFIFKLFLIKVGRNTI